MCNKVLHRPGACHPSLLQLICTAARKLLLPVLPSLPDILEKILRFHQSIPLRVGEHTVVKSCGNLDSAACPYLTEQVGVNHADQWGDQRTNDQHQDPAHAGDHRQDADQNAAHATGDH